jgi:hypothetical protein
LHSKFDPCVISADARACARRGTIPNPAIPRWYHCHSHTNIRTHTHTHTHTHARTHTHTHAHTHTGLVQDDMAVHVLVMAYDQDDLDRGVAKIKELLIPVSPEVPVMICVKYVLLIHIHLCLPTHTHTHTHTPL